MIQIMDFYQIFAEQFALAKFSGGRFAVAIARFSRPRHMHRIPRFQPPQYVQVLIFENN